MLPVYMYFVIGIVPVMLASLEYMLYCANIDIDPIQIKVKHNDDQE